MKLVKTVEDFYKHNHRELKKCLSSIMKTNIEEEVEDMAQNFYIRVMEKDTFNVYDPMAGASFSTFIWRLLTWMVVEDASSKKTQFHKNSSHRLNILSRKIDNVLDVEEEVWSKIGELDGNWRVDKSISASFATEEKSREILKNLEQFKKYLMSLKENDKKKQRMVAYINLVDYGYNGIKIAENFGVSNTLVKDIKQSVQKHYKKWSGNKKHTVEYVS